MKAAEWRKQWDARLRYTGWDAEGVIADLAASERSDAFHLDALAESERLRVAAEERAEKAERGREEWTISWGDAMDRADDMEAERDALAAKLEECQLESGRLMNDRKCLSQMLNESERERYTASLLAGKMAKAIDPFLAMLKVQEMHTPGGHGYGDSHELFFTSHDDWRATLTMGDFRSLRTANFLPADGLWEASKRYMRHLPECNLVAATSEFDNCTCTCGLDAILNRKGGK